MIIKSAFGEVKSCLEKYLKEINTKIRIFSDNVIIVMEDDDYSAEDIAAEMRKDYGV